MAELRAHGMEVLELTAEEREAFKTACRSVYDEFAPRIGAEIVEQLQAEVAKAAGK